MTDAAGQAWSYGYDVSGPLKSVAGPGSVSRSWTFDPTSHLVTAEMHPESGTVQHTHYFAGGVLERKVDANGTVFVYAYDDSRRVTQITATPASGPAQVTTFTYEPGSDRRATATVDGVTTAWTYDAVGRLAMRTDTVDGLAFTVTYAYDAQDNLASVTYPSGRQVGYAYDPLSRITRVFNVATDVTYDDQFTYHPSGALASYRAGNGVVTTLTYHPTRQWLDRLEVGTAGALLDLDYAYDGVGNITGIADPRPGLSQTFLYDPLDRLTSAQGGYGTLSYTYDAHGNRQTANSLTYGYSGNPFRLQQVGTVTLTYDPNGNLDAAGGHSYAYTPDNLMRQATVNGTTTEYRYDVDAWRLKKAVGSGTPAYYVRGPNGQLLTEWVNTTPAAALKEYLYAGGRLIGVVSTTAPAK